MSQEVVGVIYTITNMTNHRVYVGQTIAKNPRTRWSQHKSALTRNQHGNAKLQNAWNKYGSTVWRFDVIHTAAGRTALDAAEIQIIRGRNSVIAGYNIDLGGKHRIVSEETGKRLSAALRALGRWRGAGNPKWGKKLSKTHHERMIATSRAATTGVPLSRETRQKISAANTGKVRTKEMVVRLSARMSGPLHPFYNVKRPDHSARMTGKGNPNWGVVMSNTTKKKISKARRAGEAKRKRERGRSDG